MSDITISATDTRPLGGAITHSLDAGEATYVGYSVFVAADGDLENTDASNTADITGLCGLVVAGSKTADTGLLASGEHATIVLLGNVYLGPDAALDETKAIYFSETEGKLVQTAPTKYRVAGYPISTTEMFWNPDPGGPAS